MQYSNFIMKNNVHATLSTALSSVATTIQLTTGQGARFGTEFPQIATLESFDDTGKVVKREIVQITARNGDDLTVVRAFAPCPANDDANSQSQSSVSFSADDQISLYIPKEIFDGIKKSLNDIYDNGTNNMRTDIVSGLQVEVNPGSVLVGSAYYDFAGGTITLTDNATNYLEIDEDGNLANNTTGRNDENTKLAEITTSSGSVTKIKDRRLGTVGGKIGGVNIHDLTEKTTIAPDDEYIITDSESIYQNKRILAKNIIAVSLKEPTDLNVSKQGSDAVIKWNDPKETRMIPAIDPRINSKIVRKENSAPTSVSDGTVITTETTKNSYSQNGFVDGTLVEGTNYFYRIFSEHKGSWITYGDSQRMKIAQPTIRVLVVAGGGGGGDGDAGQGGGGGGGGVIDQDGISVSVGTYSVVVGAGGNGRNNNSGTNGGNSSFGTIVETVGGGGGARNGSGAGGGSGGGGQGPGGVGTAGQGYNGGGGQYGAGGGGGGAGGVGTAGSGGSGGGIGFLSDISGTEQYYAGGGGGGSAGIGGLGGGGNGGNPVGNATYYGGGGGGSAVAGGNGYQGIVIVSYDSAIGIQATGGDEIYESGYNKIHVFYNSGTFEVTAIL